MAAASDSASDSPVRLTQFARGGGCAAKLRQRELHAVLAEATGAATSGAPNATATAAVAGPHPAPPRGVIIDHAFSDDAAVVHHAPDTDLVLTTDVIAPLVDDPFTFGQIAATNAMSDVWAMGGEAKWALNLVFFSDETLPLSVLKAILAGGAHACSQAGVIVVGGHSVRDPEVKFGLAVTGEVARGQAWSNRNARAGDALVLTKALGTGILSQAIKTERASAAEIAAAVTSMTTANQLAARIARNFGVRAATDVTGFGLCGHLRNLLNATTLYAEVDTAALPLLPGVPAHLAAGFCPGGSKANRAYVAPYLRTANGDAIAAAAADAPAAAATAHSADAVSFDARVSIACDAQTSGGLLLCVPAAAVSDCVAALRATGLPATQIGQINAASTPAQQATIVLR